jgi:glycosyltransferase involved in cell wall biosynthesis
MYCGSCLHDNTLAAALLALGEDVLLVPTYTPRRTDVENVSDSHLFFGGINVYLQQRMSVFRHTPWFVDNWLNHPAILNWATRGGPSVEAQKLGDLTVSMLEGEHGRQRKEIQKLVHWLGQEARPDVVHLSNAMLVGAARQIRKLGIPVVTTLSGEDVFLEKLIAPFHDQALGVLRERVREIDAFVALNRYYAEFMTAYAGIDPAKIHVIPHGLNLAGHGTRHNRGDRTFVIGYMARICPDKGLHHLIEAAELLMRKSSTPPFRVVAAGYLSDADRPYLDVIRSRVAEWRLPDVFEYVGELTRAEKIAFLQGLDCMSLPTVYRESKGLPVLEALANAVPVVLPDHGAFPEMIEATGGGVLHAADDPQALADVLRQLMADPARVSALGRAGQQAIRRDYHATGMAQKTLELYRRVRARA